jgi:hypothetical protein
VSELGLHDDRQGQQQPHHRGTGAHVFGRHVLAS